jgi:hypothetical protein
MSDPTPATPDTDHPLTVWCLYRTGHPRGYTQRDRAWVLDTEAEAQALAESLRQIEDAKAPAIRRWYWVAPARCRARVWRLMFQECYEGAIVLGVFTRRADAEAALVSTLANPFHLVGETVYAEDLFIEDDLLL